MKRVLHVVVDEDMGEDATNGSLAGEVLAGLEPSDNYFPSFRLLQVQWHDELGGVTSFDSDFRVVDPLVWDVNGDVRPSGEAGTSTLRGGTSAT